jgi:hypothetical protein
VHATVLQIEIFANLAHAKSVQRDEQIYTYSKSEAVLQACKELRVMLEIVRKCSQAMCALSFQNKVMLTRVSGLDGIHINDNADDLARDRSCIPFLGSKLENLIPKCVERLAVKEW